MFTFVFGRLADIPSDGIHYAVFALLGPARLAVRLERRGGGRREPRGEPRPRHEGVLPAHPRARRGGAPGLVDLLPSPARSSPSSWWPTASRPTSALLTLPLWLAAALLRGARRGPLAGGAQRPLPRRPLRRRLRPAGLAVRQPGRVPELAGRGHGAVALRAQPDGRGDRRLALGARRRRRRRRSRTSSRSRRGS